MRKSILIIGMVISAIIIVGIVYNSTKGTGLPQERQAKNDYQIDTPWHRDRYREIEEREKRAREEEALRQRRAQRDKEVSRLGASFELGRPWDEVPLAPSFTRYNKKHTSQHNRKLTSTFTIDVPSDTAEYRHEVMVWIEKGITKLLREDKALMLLNPPTKIFHGDVDDEKALGQAVASFFFKEMNKDGTDSTGLSMSYDISLKAVPLNSDILTYYRYGVFLAGFRTFWTEEAVSYDIASHEEVDWDYLFKAQHREAVEALFFRTALNDRRFREEQSTIMTLEDVEEFFNDNLYVGRDAATGRLHLPQPGLVKEGVLLSFQFEEIGCVASGAFHFVLPYDEVKPYLTEKAKRHLRL